MGLNKRVKLDPEQPKTLCKARRRNGEPCRNPPMAGSTVCRMHGGAAPQVRARAQQRILEASDKAAYALVQMMQDAAIPPAVRLGAARDLLDRAGLTSKQELTLDVKVERTWDDVAPTLLVDIDDDEDDAEEAELVYDLDEPAAIEAAHDAETEERERLRRKEQRAGRSGARTTAEERAAEERIAKAKERAEFNRQHEAFLRTRLDPPSQKNTRRGKRP